MRQKRHSFGSFLFFIVCVFILGVAAFRYGPSFLERFKTQTAQSTHASSRATSKMEQKQVPVTLERAVLQDITLKNTYIGTVVPIHEVQLVPFIAGFIEKVNAAGGQAVKEGDILFTIEQSSYLAAKKVAAANVAKAKADLANASSYLERIKRTKSQAVSKTELDKAQAAFSAAQASLKGAQAALSSAEVNLGYTVIKAPISGRLGNVPVTKGNYVSPQSGSLASIIQQSPIRVAFSVPVKEYLSASERFQAGEKVILILPNGKQYASVGQIAYVDNAASKETSSIKIYADFENPDEKLIPGAYVSVAIEREMKGFLIAKNLVSLSADGDFVFLVKDEKAVKRKVVLEASLDNDYVVGADGGLLEGDLIVSSMTSSLKDGDEVKVIKLSDNISSGVPASVLATASWKTGVNLVFFDISYSALRRISRATSPVRTVRAGYDFVLSSKTDGMDTGQKQEKKGL